MSEVRIGLIGAGWMGRAHSTAYKNVPLVFGNEPAVPSLELIADLNPEWAKAGADNLGFKRWTADWREVINDPNVDVVDITTPNNVHAEIAIAAVKAGKHVYCEKPLAMTAPEAKQMVEAAEAAKVITLVGFNYLKNPVQAYARELIDAGEIGDVILFRGTFDQDFMTDPTVPYSWRMDRKIAGSGALGDMASHTLSYTQYLVGDIAEVCGIDKIVYPRRTVATGGSGHTAKAGAGAPTREVENEDLVQFLMRFANGAIGTIGATRIGTGRKLFLGYEIQGTKGALLFNQERQNELGVYRHTDRPSDRGYKIVTANPDHPWFSAFFPISFPALGYNDQKIIEARDLVVAVATRKAAQPDFRFAYKVQQVVDAVMRSIDERRWVSTGEVG